MEPKVTSRGTFSLSREDSQAKGECCWPFLTGKHPYMVSLLFHHTLLSLSIPLSNLTDLEQAWTTFGQAKSVVSGHEGAGLYCMGGRGDFVYNKNRWLACLSNFMEFPHPQLLLKWICTQTFLTKTYASVLFCVFQLQRLERDRSPPTQDRAASSYKRRSTKKGVKFDSAAGKTSPIYRGGTHRQEDRVQVLDLENHTKGNEYVLEPTALNEKTLDHLQTSPLAKRRTPLLNASQSVQFTPSPSHLSVLSNSSPRGGTSGSSSSHSNMGAVFSKPVKFGGTTGWDQSRPTLEGAEVSRLNYSRVVSIRNPKASNVVGPELSYIRNCYQPGCLY